jgi:hypothetical protein
MNARVKAVKAVSIEDSRKLDKLSKAAKRHHKALAFLIKNGKHDSPDARAETALCGTVLSEIREMIGPVEFDKFVQDRLVVKSHAGEVRIRITPQMAEAYLSAVTNFKVDMEVFGPLAKLCYLN